ncbi:MAG TPA: hypothetical protein VHC86_15980 [Opitutaceae bacterium]|nr:hypothetical protein [Opitutaceae bacterium]
MQVGKKVVCVDDIFPREVIALYQQLPSKGTQYTVREVTLGREKVAVIKNGKIVRNGSSDQGNTVRLLLVELRNPPDPLHPAAELGFNAERFREIDEHEETESLSEAEAGAVPLVG